MHWYLYRPLRLNNKPEYSQTSRQRLSWIPAFAGMTKGVWLRMLLGADMSE